MASDGSSNFLDQFRNDHTIHAVDFMRCFLHYDKDRSGKLEKKELRAFLKDLLEAKGMDGDLTPDQYLDTLMSEADIDKDGKFELGELALVLPIERNFISKFPKTEKRTKAEIDEIFSHYDVDGNGMIGGNELLALLRDMFEREGQMVGADDLMEYADLVRELYDIKLDGQLHKDDIALLLRKY